MEVDYHTIFLIFLDLMTYRERRHRLLPKISSLFNDVISNSNFTHQCATNTEYSSAFSKCWHHHYDR